MHVAPSHAPRCYFPPVAWIGCRRPCVVPVCRPPIEEPTATDPLSAPPTGRKLYAPPPVGEPTPVDKDAPPDTALRVVLIDFFYLTPAGENLDVLA